MHKVDEKAIGADKIVQHRELFFSKEEFQHRLQRVRQGMAENSIDLLLVHTPLNTLYLTGYQTIGLSNYQCLFVPLEGDLTILVRFLEYFSIRYSSLIEDSRVWDDHEDPVDVTCDILKEKNALNKRIGIEKGSKFLSITTLEKLARLLPKATIVDAGGIVEKCRMIKSAQEIAYMREAALRTQTGMQEAYDAVREGNTENDIAAAAFKGMLKNGGDYLTNNPIVTSGFRSGIPHTTFAGRKVQKGDTILFEISGGYRRYYAPLMRAAVLGKPSEKVKTIADVTIAALNRAIDAMKPGATSGGVHDACEKGIVKAGYGENFRKRTGYSVGSGFPPSWMEGHIIDLNKNDKRVLQPGMVFHLPVALRLYGECCVGFSETVLVTEKGSESLTKFPRELFVRE